MIKKLCKVFPKLLAYHKAIVFTHYKEEEENDGTWVDPKQIKITDYVPDFMKIMSKCTNEKIFIYNSIKENANININLIHQLEESEINLFDINSNFYQDKCISFNLNNNDITIKDRREDIYPIVSICEPDCKFKEIN